MTRDDALGGGYSPRRVRFYLAHWDSLLAIAESPESARAELDGLRREWTLIAYWAAHSPAAAVCYCADTNDGRPSPGERLGGAAAFGPPAHSAALILADLAAAADALPLPWHATGRVFAAQGRADLWAARLAQHRALGLPRAQDRLIEPPAADFAAVALLARALGWRPRPEEVS